MNNEKPNIMTGGLRDYRIKEEQDKDWQHEEVFAGVAPVVWREKSLGEIRRYSPRNQGMSLSCVANGIAIALEANEKVESGYTRVFSHKDVYIRRRNKPYGGMSMEDALRIMREGAALEDQVPSMGLSETPINQEYPVTEAIRQARATYAALSTYIVKTPTFDKVAEIIEMNLTLTAFWFFSKKFRYDEWWDGYARVVEKDLPEFDLNDYERVLHHQAHIVDYGLYNGEKVLFIQDSAGVGLGLGEFGDIRIVNLEFFTKRLFGLGYGIDKKNLDYVQPVAPSYKFTRVLKSGMDGEDVRMLQKILVYEGCMDIKEPTIHFRGATRAAVIKYQEKYKAEILTPIGLRSGTGIVAARTIAHLNSKYAPK